MSIVIVLVEMCGKGRVETTRTEMGRKREEGGGEEDNKWMGGGETKGRGQWSSRAREHDGVRHIKSREVGRRTRTRIRTARDLGNWYCTPCISEKEIHSHK